MIWHIFRKDLKLLWPLVAGVALLHLASRFVLYKAGHFGGGIPALSVVMDMLVAAEYMGSAFLIAAVIHQDPVPGVRQDWLVRPVKRGDLMAAKLLFVLLLVQGPMLVADWLGAMMYGFGPLESLAAALSRGLFLLFLFYLMFTVFVSLTANLMETLVAGLFTFLGGGAIAMLLMTQNTPGRQLLAVTQSGLRWISDSAHFLVVLAGAVILLRLQYFQRRIMLGRYVFATASFLWILMFFFPWQPAFAIQQRLSPNPGAAATVQVAFDSVPRPKEPVVDPDRPRIAIQGIQVYLPFRVHGLPDDSVLVGNHTDVYLTDPSGARHKVGGGDMEARQDGPAAGDVAIRQAIQMPPFLYEKLKDKTVRVEMEHSLTLFRVNEANAIPALNGDQRIPGVGWCETRLNDAQTAVRVRCMAPGKPPSCIMGFLEDPASGRRNPASTGCRPDYTPYVANIVYDAMGRFGTSLAFRDPAGLAKYPVTGPQLKEARVVLRVYREQEHFMRRVVIDKVRLEDWEVR